MDLSSLPLFAALTRKMAWLTERQSVLSQNIANANTPNYQAVDLKPLDFAGELGRAAGKLQLVSTNPQHLQSASATGNLDSDDLAHTGDDRTIAGNTVSMEDELIKVSQTGADYQLMTNLYKKQIGMLKDAIGHGSGGS